MSGLPSDARWIVDIAQQHLRDAAERDDDAPLGCMVAGIATDVRSRLSAWSRRPAFPPSAAIGLVRLRGELIEYLVLTDALVTIEGEAAWVWTDDAVIRTNRGSIAAFRRALDETGSFSMAYARVRPLLRRHRETSMNRPDGYWVLSDEPTAAAHAICGAVAAERAGRILLATDGFSRLVDCFGLYGSWQEFLASGVGLDVALRQLRDAEAADPEALAFPRWSVSDDAAALIVAAR